MKSTIRFFCLIFVMMLFFTNNANANDVSCTTVTTTEGPAEIQLSSQGLKILDGCLEKIKQAMFLKVVLSQEKISQRAESVGLNQAPAILQDTINQFDYANNEQVYNVINEAARAGIGEHINYTKEIMLQKDAMSCKGKTITVEFKREGKDLFSPVELTDKHSIIKTAVSELSNLPFANSLVISHAGGEPITLKGNKLQEGVVIADKDKSVVKQFLVENRLPLVTVSCAA